MEKLDLTKLYKNYFTAKTIPGLVEIETAQFLSLTGKGDPSGKEFAQKVQVLYATAYAVKFISKALKKDFTVSKLEGLWWFDEAKFGNLSIADAPAKVNRSEWEYRLLIRMPEFVTREMADSAIETVITKKQIHEARNIELYSMKEGKCVQMLHIGPFATEPETLKKMSEFIKEKKLVKNGIHHEIYLSDFRKTSPEKLKTILREPVK